MTTEQKAKAYDELLIKAKQIYNKENDVLIMHTIEDLFPELAESEDERIRKELIKVFSNREKYLIDQSFGDITVSEALTWLEKQGEHANFRNKIQIGDKVTRNEDGVLVNLSQLKRVAKKDEKQGEQKSQRMISAEAKEAMYGKTADKVEPKFKVGDWCIDNEDGTIFQIVKVLDNTYTYKTNEDKEYSCSHYSLENDAHLWTIQDAKDSDVLACNEEILLFKSYSVQGRISLYCWYNGQTNNFHSKEVVDTLMTTRNKIYPATKEQRDLLFKKMKEAGYTFDFEKKELKKIEQPELTEFEEAVKDMIDDYRDAIDAHAATTEEVKERAAYMLSLIPHKSAEWSEEDERAIGIIKTALEHPYDMEGKWDRKFALDWLKSLKQRYTWKPSDKQMEQLGWIAEQNKDNMIGKELMSLYQDLKKLKGE